MYIFILAATVDDLYSLISEVNRNLESVRCWACKFGLQMNAKKSQAIVNGSPYYVNKLSEVYGVFLTEFIFPFPLLSGIWVSPWTGRFLDHPI
jgi:hypothetical protein